MNTAVPTQSRSVTVGLVTKWATEGPLPMMFAPVAAEGLGAPEHLPTLATDVSPLRVVNKLVAVEVGPLVKTPATGVAEKGWPRLGCPEH